MLPKGQQPQKKPAKPNLRENKMKPAKTQQDHNMDFDGMAGTGVNRGANRFAGNQWSGHSNDGRLVNKGRGPTQGNTDHKPMTVGKPVTKDGYRPVPECHTPAVKPGKDMFTGSAQMRQPSGTRAWEPQAKENYRGNPDKINVSGYSMGDGKTSKGSRPVSSPTNPDGMNYGPKKQY